MSKRVKNKLDPKDTTQPGIAKRMRNLMPSGLLTRKAIDILREYANQEEMLAQYAPALVASMIEQSLDLSNPQVAANCKMYLLDKLYGKAVQPLLISGNIEVSHGVIVLSKPNTTQDTFDTDEHGNIISAEVIDVKTED